MPMPTTPLLKSGKIDIHDMPSQIRAGEARLRRDSTVTERNKVLILEFLRDCELGKTVRDSQKKKIGKARVTKYLVLLRQLASWLRVDFDRATQRQMEDLVLGLENNLKTQKGGLPYADSVKRDFKITLRKFYKWLLGKNEVYPEIVRWIDTRDVVPEIPCLSRLDIECLSEHAATPLERAVIWVLFDSGARAEEFLNIRFRHLEEIESEGQSVYRVRIEYSKTKPRSILLPMASKYMRTHVEARAGGTSEDQVFPLPYSRLLCILRRVGQRSVGRKVHPHLLRHSSATYYAPLLNRASFCYRFGWSYSSNMADRYIDREALNDQESMRAVKAKTTETVQRENARLQEDIVTLRDRLNQVDAFMNALVHDPEVAQILAKKIRQLGQGERLNELRLQARRPASVGDASIPDLIST